MHKTSTTSPTVEYADELEPIDSVELCTAATRHSKEHQRLLTLVNHKTRFTQ